MVHPSCQRTLEERFWEKVDKDGPFPDDASLGNCWVWRDGLRLDKDGYGSIRALSSVNTWVQKRAHQVAWMIANGEYSTISILHHCDNPRCVRIEHLYEGTHADNMKDKKRRGRGLGINKGNNYSSKYTKEQVDLVRRESGNSGKCELSRRLGIPRESIYAMLNPDYKWKTT